jgi:hypothetical protein
LSVALGTERADPGSWSLASRRAWRKRLPCVAGEKCGRVKGHTGILPSVHFQIIIAERQIASCFRTFLVLERLIAAAQLHSKGGYTEQAAELIDQIVSEELAGSSNMGDE